MSTEADTVSQEHVQVAELLNCSLPTSRVKKICRLDPDLSMIGSDAILFITKATELFVAELAKASYTQAVLEKRKTIQTKDIDRAISSKAVFEFLEGTLSDWPETENSKGFSQTQVSTEKDAIIEEDMENIEEDVVENTEDDATDKDVDLEENLEDADGDVEENASDYGGAEDANTSNVDMFE